jgi:8-oxo-dGTP pyrophosphatase MutT (NUDIX family)
MLILKDINNNPKVYFSYSDKDKEYHAPGGGWNENEDPEEAAVREAREEIHVNVKNVKPFGERLEYYEEIRDWVKDHVSNKKDWWYGYYSKIYVGEYDSKFTGKVNKEDEDSEINSGKFYVFDDIKDKIYPEYKSAIEAYLRSYK